MLKFLMKTLLLLIIITSNILASDYGKLLFNGNCVTCHFETKKVSAPSIKEVRKHYINAFPNEKDFVEYMVTWVLKPNSTTSLMQESIKEFELMPELGYDAYTLKEIAKYIYKTDFK